MPKASRRKQQQALSSAPSLEEGQKVGRVVCARGENNYEVEDACGAKGLYQLPKRLRHVVFIRRGSFVFVREDDTRREGRVRGDIEVVVLGGFLGLLRKEPYWPERFREEGVVEEAADEGEGQEVGEQAGEEWEIGGGNPNRAQWVHESSDEESE